MTLIRRGEDHAQSLSRSRSRSRRSADQRRAGEHACDAQTVGARAGAAAHAVTGRQARSRAAVLVALADVSQLARAGLAVAGGALRERGAAEHAGGVRAARRTAAVVGVGAHFALRAAPLDPRAAE